MVEAVLQAARRERAAVDGNLVDEAVERAAGLRAHRGANPQLVVVHDRRGVGLAAHVPRALHLHAVNVALDARALAERVSHRDVMPAGAGREAFGRSPAMPVLLGFLLRLLRTGDSALRVAEEEAHARRAVVAAQAQRVILVVRREALVARAPLADDVNLLPVLDALREHPRLDRERIALAEIQRTFRTGVLHADELALAAETRRRAVRLELGELRRELSALTELHFALDRAVERRCVRPGREVQRRAAAGVVQAPVSHRLVRENQVGVARGLGGRCRMGRQGGNDEEGEGEARCVHVASTD